MLLSPSIIRAGRMPVSPNDKIHVGLIGCNSMGFSDLSAFLHNSEVECVALADVDQRVLDRRVADVEKAQGRKPQGIYKDWRRLIEDKNVDVVICSWWQRARRARMSIARNRWETASRSVM